MSTKTVAYLLAILIIFSSFFLVTKALNAQQGKNPTQIPDISAQLQQVIQNQQLIISKLNDMKEELRIIKIRATVKR
ncbi:MAG: hypothetical protein JSW18_00995 [Candidatus Omnitrophota bacterium]|nr:MAG: hypothetical protein JSW18_00995 [Candidatus Omnitrophota bacterium]